MDPFSAAMVAQLRARFDQSFSRPMGAPTTDGVELIVIQVAEERYAVRLSDLSGLQADLSPVPLPGGGGALLGMIGFRGRVVPVYDLAALLGHGHGRPTWAVLCAGGDTLALAFHALEEFRCVPRADILPSHERDGTGEVVTLSSGVCRVLDVPAVVADVRRQAGVEE